MVVEEGWAAVMWRKNSAGENKMNGHSPSFYQRSGSTIEVRLEQNLREGMSSTPNDRGLAGFLQDSRVGSNSLYPCDLIPFTRKPLFLIIDSNNSHAFKAGVGVVDVAIGLVANMNVIHGEEKGETMAMLLSPTSQAPATGATSESSRNQNISQFTMFLTAPVQAFCILLGVSGINMEKASIYNAHNNNADLSHSFQETYNNAEKLFSSSLNDWENALLASDELHPIWIEVLGDPFLRRFLLSTTFAG
ncbi:hypothetical protein M5K25_023744 [Dendrobium thyrsiflorum]|uniref:Uncharacterized protein n=1 Tax=Dendrobium thyrsiflorum TaxID=117978 RepID=A0ABD0U036_DENTH